VGTIDGDLRFMGEHCRIEGRVTGDVDFTGERLTLGPEGVIEGDVEVTGETFENEGTVGGSISGVYGN
jgi:cytoskeletal protein CcmA (bactofilin family)